MTIAEAHRMARELQDAENARRLDEVLKEQEERRANPPAGSRQPEESIAEHRWRLLEADRAQAAATRAEQDQRTEAARRWEIQRGPDAARDEINRRLRHGPEDYPAGNRPARIVTRSS